MQGDITTTIILSDDVRDGDGRAHDTGQGDSFAQTYKTTSTFAGPSAASSTRMTNVHSRQQARDSSASNGDSVMLEATLPDGTVISLPARIVRKHIAATGAAKDLTEEQAGTASVPLAKDTPQSYSTRQESLREMLQQTGLQLDGTEHQLADITENAEQDGEIPPGESGDMDSKNRPRTGSAGSGSTARSSHGAAMGLNMRPRSAITVVRVRPPTSGSVRSSRPISGGSKSSGRSSLPSAAAGLGAGAVPAQSWSPRSSEDAAAADHGPGLAGKLDNLEVSDHHAALDPGLLVSPMQGAIQSIRRAVTPGGTRRGNTGGSRMSRSYSQEMPPTARDDDSMAMDPPTDGKESESEKPGSPNSKQSGTVGQFSVSADSDSGSGGQLRLVQDGDHEPADAGTNGTIEWKQASSSASSFNNAIGFLN